MKSVSYLSVPFLQKSGFLVSISTRIGGVSQKPYHSLNLSYHVGDDPEAVNENRERFSEAIGFDLDSLVIAQQVHGDKVSVVDNSKAGCGAFTHKNAIPGADAMITRSKKLTLGILTADCVPIMIADPVEDTFGIAHAGWRGTLHSIGAKTVIKMQNEFAIKPKNCIVILGPAIRPCCYSVGEDLVKHFIQEFGSEVCVSGNNLDLHKALEIQLVKAGIQKENIFIESLCTSCNTDLLYSHRAENGHTGRIMSIIKRI
ncbi:peptidoglycan editing factor PgeF [Candidatus Poribacteria bacterium]|nr:peptidoglycan editing factor PgeF [Candidatus Poribacteria bacterium]